MRLFPNTVATAVAHSQRHTLSLRDLTIPLVENVETLPDIFETLDLTNNEIITLGNFPLLMRTHTVLMARNKVSFIQRNLDSQIPMVKTLSLVNNSLADYATLETLSCLRHLENLYITGNPVMLMEHTREFVIWCLPQLRVLNFERVKQSERLRARELFGDLDEPTALAHKLRNAGKRNTLKEDSDGITHVLKKLSDEEKEQLKQQLKLATSLKEIERIEDALRNGYL